MTKEEISKLLHSYPRLAYGMLKTSAQGLSDSEAEKRLTEYGKNLIEKKKKTPLWKVFLSNFISPLAILLWIAGIISLICAFIPTSNSSDAILKDPSMLYLAVAIWMVNMVNGVFSFMQQAKASKATDALANMLPQYARVIRNGRELKINASDLVPGDIMILAEGDRISADARILMCDDLTCAQSALDGEATPTRKTMEPMKNDPDSLVGAKNVVFAGTSVSTGSARAVVYATGMHTEFGKIASLTQNIKPKKSNLQIEIDRTTNVITKIALSIGITLFIMGVVVYGLQRDKNGALGFSNPSMYLEQFVFALGMIVAFIPEGLPPLVTLSLAKAVQKMAKEGALIKSLTSVETLGSTTVICSDKTGTLTKNEMTVKSLYFNNEVYTVTGDGYDPKGDILDRNKQKLTGQNNLTLKILLTIGALANDARILPPEEGKKVYTVLGDPTEACLSVVAEKGLISGGNQLNLIPRIRELNFDSTRKMMTTIHQLETPVNDCQRIAFTKGAPKEILEKCTMIFDGDKPRPITKEDIEKAMKQNDAYAKEGLRVLAMTYRLLPKGGEVPVALSDYKPENIEKNLVFVGLQAMQDPPREGIKEAIAECHKAGIKVIMVTGDYGLTALAIGKKIGIITGKDPLIVTGVELAKMTDDQLKQALKREIIFARMAPDQKYRVVCNLQELGNVVAVTGDGVNDAPALKKANIGIAMGITGTDVAKDAADMILTDDNFTSIVKAIKEGRAVYSNIKKFITYIFNSNIPEGIPFALPILTNTIVPIPLTILEVLLVDLGTDMIPALGLGSEPPTSNIMDQKPRRLDDHIINKQVLLRALGFGLQTTVLSLAAFFLYDLFESQRLGLPYTFFKADTLINGAENPLIWMSSTAVVLVSIVLCQVGMVFNCRSHRESVFKQGLFSNKEINKGIVAELIIVCLAVYLPWINQNIFEAYSITSWQIWLVMLTFPFILVGIEEARKYIVVRRQKTKRKKTEVNL